MNKIIGYTPIPVQDTSKILCLSNDLTLSIIDSSNFSGRDRRILGEVFESIENLEDDSESPEYLECDGRILDSSKYPELASSILNVYKEEFDPPNTCRIPNLMNGQLFIRCAGPKFPLGKISYDTFKSHTHDTKNYDGYSTQNRTRGSNRSGISSNNFTQTTGGIRESSLVSQFNETALKNYVFKYFIKAK